MKSKAFMFVIFLATIAVAAFATIPAWNTWRELQEVLLAKEAELQTRQRYVETLRAASLKLRSFPQALAVLDSVLPSDPNLPSLYNLVQDLASASGLGLKSMSSVSGQSTDPSLSNLEMLDMSIALSGSYEALKEFLQSVKSAPRFLQVESISFGAPQKEEFIFTLRISAFFQ